MRGTDQVREVDLLGLVVEDRRLDRAFEEVVGVAGEELVKRVVAGDVHGESAPPAPGAPPHLAQARDRAGEGHDDGRIERTDVDPQLERVGRDHRAQLAADQSRLDLAPLRRRVAGAIGHHQLTELAGADPLQLVARDPRQQLDAPCASGRSRSCEHRPRPARASSSAPSRERRAAHAEHLVGQRRIPDRDPPPRRGRAVALDQRHVVETGQPLRELDRVGDRRRGEQDPGLGSVRGSDPAQPPQHVGDVGAEHAAVGVGLVDDDHGEVRE